MTSKEPAPEQGSAQTRWDPRSRADAIERWIEQLFATPIFLTGEVLEFLGIEGEHAAPFLTYHESSYHLFCSKNYLVMMQKRQGEKKRSVFANGLNQVAVKCDSAVVVSKTDHEQLMDLLEHSF